MSASYDLNYSDPSREHDFWTDVPATTNGTHPTAHTLPARTPKKAPDPLDRVRRLLRGRATLAIVLAIGGGLLGTALGWYSQSPTFQAYGNAMIPPVLPKVGDDDEGVPHYKMLMKTEAQLIESLPIAAEAMEQEVWQEQVGQKRPPAAFASNVEARYNDNDQFLHVTYTAESPETALAGTTAVLQAYQQDFLRRQQRVDNSTIATLENKLNDLTLRLERLNSTIAEKSDEYGGVQDLNEKLNALNADQQLLREERMRIERDLAQAEQAREQAQDPATVPLAQLLRYDEDLRQLANAKAEAEQLRNEMVARGLGLRHRQVARLVQRIEMLNEQMTAREKEARAEFFGEVPNLAGEGTVQVTLSHIEALQARRADVDAQMQALSEEIRQVAADRAELAALTRERENLLIAEEETTARLESARQNAAYQGELGTIKLYLPPAGTAQIAEDKRPATALGGAMAGFAIPLACVLGLGLMDSRFRYSDDAAEASERVTLLGILPNLPDRLSDPNQASIAAHCVHQIRTMLQINHGSDESRAFAVTSAQRGDGKTSLALALGLSYAASGARTLLIDTDLQRGGLTQRLGVKSDEGIMDALTGGELLEYTAETDVTDLAILPIGRAAANHAGAFSPGAVRHLLDQGRRHFDVIICDTGPILGSIEATPIASAVDGVLLTVSRGQSRPLVSKALNHLDGLGATISGLVFNRAQAADFERSVSGMNIRGGSSPHLPGRANGVVRSTTLSQN